MREFIKGLQEGFKEFGENIAGIVNAVLLSVVYFVGVGPTALVAKISGKSFIETKPDKKAKSYWSNLDLGKKDTDEYYRQF